jgi:hypothetical protein
VAESFLVDLMTKRVGPFASGVVAGPFHRLCDVITSNHVPSGIKVPQAALLHALKEARWLDMGRIGSTEHQTKKHIFASPDVAQRYNKSELRRMVEGVASSDAKVVKP